MQSKLLLLFLAAGCLALFRVESAEARKRAGRREALDYQLPSTRDRRTLATGAPGGEHVTSGPWDGRSSPVKYPLFGPEEVVLLNLERTWSVWPSRLSNGFFFFKQPGSLGTELVISLGGSWALANTSNFYRIKLAVRGYQDTTQRALDTESFPELVKLARIWGHCNRLVELWTDNLRGLAHMLLTATPLEVHR